jgi:hypothetical protein
LSSRRRFVTVHPVSGVGRKHIKEVMEGFRFSGKPSLERWKHWQLVPIETNSVLMIRKANPAPPCPENHACQLMERSECATFEISTKQAQ